MYIPTADSPAGEAQPRPGTSTQEVKSPRQARPAFDESPPRPTKGVKIQPSASESENTDAEGVVQRSETLPLKARRRGKITGGCVEIKSHEGLY